MLTFEMNIRSNRCTFTEDVLLTVSSLKLAVSLETMARKIVFVFLCCHSGVFFFLLDFVCTALRRIFCTSFLLRCNADVMLQS